MTELREKIFHHFAFLKISANSQALHRQATLKDTQTNACQRATTWSSHK